jgi:hypothetical protein
MKKNELISLIRSKLTGGTTSIDSNNRYHPRVVEKSIEMGYDSILGEILKGAEKFNGYTLPNTDAMIKPFIKDVLFDEERESYYIDLHVDDARLLRQITLPKDSRYLFAIIETISEPMWDNLEVNQIDDTIGVMPELDRTYFDNKFPSKLHPTKVLAKIIPNFSQLSATDEIKVPTEVLYASSMNFWNNQRPNDDLNENKQTP